MRKIKIKNCIICSSNKFAFISLVKTKPFHFSIYKCCTCRLLFQNPMPSKRMLRSLYENIYNKKYKLVSTEEAFEHKDYRQERYRINRIEKFVKGGKLLDIGASTGFFLSEVKRRKKWDAYGLEYSKKAVKIAKRKYNLTLLRGEIHNTKLPNNYYNVITMHSVLEHIPDIGRTLRIIRMKLKDGGFFIFNVPNVRSFEFYLYKMLNKQFAGFISEHLYYFTPKVIEQLLKKNGFDVVYMTSRHHSTLKLPPLRPLIGLLTFVPKLLLEYTDFGGKLKLGNIIYIYAKKNL